MHVDVESLKVSGILYPTGVNILFFFGARAISIKFCQKYDSLKPSGYIKAKKEVKIHFW